MRKVVALSLLLVAIAVAACNIVPGIVTPVVKIGQWDSLRDKWEKIGDRLDEMFGQSFKNDEILQVRVPVRACVLGVCAVSADVSFIKPCGKSFKEAAYEISTRAPGGGGDAGGGGGGGLGGGGGTGGDGGDGGIPFSGCEPYTIQTCIGTNCRWDSYITCAG